MPSLYLNSAQRLVEICLSTEDGKLDQQIGKSQFVCTLGTGFGIKADDAGKQDRLHRKGLMVKCFPDLFVMDDGPDHELVRDLSSGIFDFLREPSLLAQQKKDGDNEPIELKSVFDNNVDVISNYGKEDLTSHSAKIMAKFLRGIRTYYDDQLSGYGTSQQYSSEKMGKQQKPRGLKLCLTDVLTQYLVAVMTLAMETSVSEANWSKWVNKVALGPSRVVIQGAYKEEIADIKDATLRTYQSQITALLTSCSESQEAVKVQNNLAKTAETLKKWITAVKEKAKESADYAGVEKSFDNFLKDEWEHFQAHAFKFVQESGRLPIIQVRHAKIVDTMIKKSATKFAEKLKISNEINQLATWYQKMRLESEKMTKLHPLAVIDSEDEDPEDLVLYTLSEDQKAVVSSNLDSSTVKEASNAANDYDMCVTPIIKLDDPRSRFDPPVYTRDGDETIKDFFIEKYQPYCDRVNVTKFSQRIKGIARALHFKFDRKEFNRILNSREWEDLDKGSAQDYQTALHAIACKLDPRSRKTEDDRMNDFLNLEPQHPKEPIAALLARVADTMKLWKPEAYGLPENQRWIVKKFFELVTCPRFIREKNDPRYRRFEAANNSGEVAVLKKYLDDFQTYCFNSARPYKDYGNVYRAAIEEPELIGKAEVQELLKSNLAALNKFQIPRMMDAIMGGDEKISRKSVFMKFDHFKQLLIHDKHGYSAPSNKTKNNHSRPHNLAQTSAAAQNSSTRYQDHQSNLGKTCEELNCQGLINQNWACNHCGSEVEMTKRVPHADIAYLTKTLQHKKGCACSGYSPRPSGWNRRRQKRNNKYGAARRTVQKASCNYLENKPKAECKLMDLSAAERRRKRGVDSLIIPVTVNEKPLNCVLDTGATDNLLNIDQYEELKESYKGPLNYEKLRFKQADGSVVTAKAGMVCEVASAEMAETKPISEMLFYGYEGLVDSAILGLPFVFDLLDRTGEFSLRKKETGEIYLETGKLGSIRVFTNMGDVQDSGRSLRRVTTRAQSKLLKEDPKSVTKDTYQKKVRFEEDPGIPAKLEPKKPARMGVRNEEDVIDWAETEPEDDSSLIEKPEVGKADEKKGLPSKEQIRAKRPKTKAARLSQRPKIIEKPLNQKDYHQKSPLLNWLQPQLLGNYVLADEASIPAKSSTKVTVLGKNWPKHSKENKDQLTMSSWTDEIQKLLGYQSNAKIFRRPNIERKQDAIIFEMNLVNNTNAEVCLKAGQKVGCLHAYKQGRLSQSEEERKAILENLTLTYPEMKFKPKCLSFDEGGDGITIDYDCESDILKKNGLEPEIPAGKKSKNKQKTLPKYLIQNMIEFEEDGSWEKYVRKGPNHITEIQNEEDDAGGNGVQLRLTGTETGLQICPLQTEIRNEEDIVGISGPKNDATFIQKAALVRIDLNGLPI